MADVFGTFLGQDSGVCGDSSWPGPATGPGPGLGGVTRRCLLEVKTDRILTDITDIIFIFIFLVGFEYG